MPKGVLRNAAVVDALRAALDDGELDVYYQPIVSLADGRMLAVEALVRWRHPQWGWVSPSEFVPLAEEHGLIVTLGKQVLGQAARQAAQWRRRYPDAFPHGVFVNVSPPELSSPQFVPSLMETLSEHGLAASDIAVEITERVFLDEGDNTLTRNPAQLVRIGIRLGLDDFGTGFSALASLQRFPFTILKIDRYFIRSIRSQSDTAPIAAAIVGLGKTLGLTVVAEGIEGPLQADYLRSLGCDAGQGFHFARPQPSSDLTAILNATVARQSTGMYPDEQRRAA